MAALGTVGTALAVTTAYAAAAPRLAALAPPPLIEYGGPAAPSVAVAQCDRCGAVLDLSGRGATNIY